MTVSRKLSIITTLVTLAMTGATLIGSYFLRSRSLTQDLNDKAAILASEYISLRHVIAVNQDKINNDGSGNFKFKGLNPARVGNLVAKDFNKKSSIKIKQTSLRVRNKEMGEPDEFEREQLKIFATNKTLEPISMRSTIDDKPVFRYMFPIQIKEACLKCHGEPRGEIDISGYKKEGYKVGDIRGAISVIVPMEQELANMREQAFIVAVGGILLALLLIITLQFFLRKMMIKPIIELAESADRISMGDLDVSVTFEQEDEIGHLSQSFERMRISMKKSIALLEEEE